MKEERENTQPTQREWVKPAFDRESLKDALSSGAGTGVDGPSLYS